ncbi:uncharacterized protein JCM15063_001742 [Sporobolomyces koalae]|uniref:uncharacterized protein n=1 Tax=Sporobolomyces koalae TaxID=500713 RepID=UPI003179397C
MTARPRIPSVLAPVLRRTNYNLPPLLSSLPRSAASGVERSTLSSGETTLNHQLARPDQVNGWIRSVRKQKNVSFAVISDGTRVGGTQVVLPKGFEQGLTVGCSASFEGEWVKSPKANSSDEFKVNRVTWIGPSDAETYPIPNTKQGIPLPILRHNAHLRNRKEQQANVMRVRSEMNWAMSNYFRSEGFLKVEAPIMTSSDCEGGGEVFKVVDATPPTFSTASTSASSTTPPLPLSPATSEPGRYLSVSSQLHLEALASSHPRVYALSPCFRAEKSDTARHLQEFWMLEAELAFLDQNPRTAIEQVMRVVEQSVRAIARHVKEHLVDEYEYLRDQAKGGSAATAAGAGTCIDLDERYRGLLQPNSYHRMTYTEAVERLQQQHAIEPFKFEPEWGSGLATEHEKWLAEDLIQGPVFVTDYPTRLKPFYMLKNEVSPLDEPQDRSTTACFDLLVPQLGELVGGSLRTHSYSDLIDVIQHHPKLNQDDYEWYLDLRKFGTTRHGGFGLGWERFVGFLTGMSNVRECIAFPKAGEGSRF